MSSSECAPKKRVPKRARDPLSQITPESANERKRARTMSLEPLSPRGDAKMATTGSCSQFDVRIICGGTSFGARKDVLARKSPVFSRMFSVKMRESATNEAVLGWSDGAGGEGEIARVAIRLAHDESSLMGITEDNAMRLCTFAATYQLASVQSRCENFLAKRVNPTGRIITLSSLYSLETVRKAALDRIGIEELTAYAQSHRKEFLQWSPDTLLRAFKRASCETPAQEAWEGFSSVQAYGAAEFNHYRWRDLVLTLTPNVPYPNILSFDNMRHGEVRFDCGRPVAFLKTQIFGGEKMAWNIEYSDDQSVWKFAATLRNGWKSPHAPSFSWASARWSYLGSHRFWRFRLLGNKDGDWVVRFRWYATLWDSPAESIQSGSPEKGLDIDTSSGSSA